MDDIFDEELGALPLTEDVRQLEVAVDGLERCFKMALDSISRLEAQLKAKDKQIEELILLLAKLGN